MRNRFILVMLIITIPVSSLGCRIRSGQRLRLFSIQRPPKLIRKPKSSAGFSLSRPVESKTRHAGNLPLRKPAMQLQQKDRESEIEFGLNGNFSLEPGSFLKDLGPYSILKRTDCIRLANRQSERMIRKSDCIQNVALDSRQQAELDLAIKLNRQRVANELAAEAIGTLYSLRCEIAKKQLLRESFSDLELLDSQLEMAQSKGLPVDEQTAEIRELRGKLTESALQVHASQAALNENLLRMFPETEGSSFWPEISLLVEKPVLVKTKAMAVALAKRVETDPGYRDSLRRNPECEPVSVVVADPEKKIREEINLAWLEFENRLHRVKLAQVEFRTLSTEYQDLQMRDQLLENAAAEMAIKRIELNQAKIRFVDTIRDYFLARASLDERMGTASSNSEF